MGKEEGRFLPDFRSRLEVGVSSPKKMKRMVLLTIFCLISVLTIVSPSLALGVKIESGILSLPDGKSIKVGPGFYLTQNDATDVASGIEILKADLQRIQAERDAYKEAYEREKDTNDKIAQIYKDLYLKYEQKADLLEQYIAATEKEIALLKSENNILKFESKVYKTSTSILGIALIIALL